MSKHAAPRKNIVLDLFSALPFTAKRVKLFGIGILMAGSITATALPTPISAPPVTGDQQTVEERLRDAFLPPLNPAYDSEIDMIESYTVAAQEEIKTIISAAATNKQAKEEAIRLAEEQAAAAEAARIAAEQEAARVAAEEASRIAAEQEAIRVAAEQEVARVAAEEEAARVAAEKKPASRSAVRADTQGSRTIAAQMVAEHGWNDAEFICLESLWQKESNWQHTAENPSSGAYGIPQSLPGNKMASAGSDWQTNPATQITWGLGYIEGRYGSPCGAWEASQAKGWY